MSIPKTSFWNLHWLMKEFEEKVVRNLIWSAWAIDEMAAGIPQETIVNDIWQGYESWAEEYFYKVKEMA